MMDTPSSSPLKPKFNPTTQPLQSLGWLKINLAILGSLLLFIGGFHLTHLLFNEGMMLLGAYHFTFILLYWVLFIDAMLNVCIRYGCALLKKPVYKASRTVSVIITYIFIVFFILIFILSVLPALSVQIEGFRQFLPRLLLQLQNVSQLIETHVGLKLPPALFEQTQALQNHLLGGLFTLGSKSITPFFYIVLGQLVSLYLLVDGAKITKVVTVLLPHSRNNRLSRGLLLSQVLMFRTMKAYLWTAILSGVVMFGIFTLLMLPYAGVLAIVYGLLCFIPVLGPWLGLLLPAIILLTQLSVFKLVVLGVLTGGFHVLRSKYISPRLFDRRYRLHPLVLLLILQMSIDVAGLWGVLFIIPMAVLLATTKRLFLPHTVQGSRSAS
ncbi:MAG: AI-2E family transporter [Vampirovibrio sp.]